jgi:hypothetical protein
MIAIEVLSPSMGRRDRHEKPVGYFGVLTLQHYLIVDAERRILVHHARPGDAIATRILRGGALRLDPPGLDLSNEDLFGEPWHASRDGRPCRNSWTGSLIQRPDRFQASPRVVRDAPRKSHAGGGHGGGGRGRAPRRALSPAGRSRPSARSARRASASPTRASLAAGNAATSPKPGERTAKAASEQVSRSAQPVDPSA